MGPDDADEICGGEVRPQYNRSLHVPTDYKRLCEWLIIDCEGAGDLADSAHVFSPEAFLMKGWYPMSKS